MGDELRRGLLLALPLVLLITLINPLVSQEGDTLLVRGGEVLGHRFDVTFEAVAFGAIAGLRIATIVGAFALFSACVDPDELLRAFRRVGFRSALTATLATRLVPVLARDATRMGDAGKCRAEPAGRAARGAGRAGRRARARRGRGRGARGARLCRPRAPGERARPRPAVPPRHLGRAGGGGGDRGGRWGSRTRCRLGEVEAYPRFAMDAGARGAVVAC